MSKPIQWTITLKFEDNPMADMNQVYREIGAAILRHGYTKLETTLSAERGGIPCER